MVILLTRYQDVSSCFWWDIRYCSRCVWSTRTWYCFQGVGTISSRVCGHDGSGHQDISTRVCGDRTRCFNPNPVGSCVWTWPEHKLSVSPHHLHTFCFCSNGLSCVFPAWNLDLTYVLFTFCTCWVVLSVQVEDGAAERTETVLKLGRTVKYLACI